MLRNTTLKCGDLCIYACFENKFEFELEYMFFFQVWVELRGAFIQQMGCERRFEKTLTKVS